MVLLHLPRCSLQRRLATLLDDGTGQKAPGLVPLAWLIITTGRPWARLIWLSRGSTARLLQTLASGTVAIDHAGVDSLSPGKEVEYLRQLLMGAGIIERRDTQLGNFERWSVRWLDAIDDPEHQRLLRTYLVWRHHRDLAARAATGPLPYSTVAVCRSKANAGLRWLRWLADRGGTVKPSPKPTSMPGSPPPPTPGRRRLHPLGRTARPPRGSPSDASPPVE